MSRAVRLFTCFALISVLALVGGWRAGRCAFGGAELSPSREMLTPSLRFVAVLRSAIDRAGGNALSWMMHRLGTFSVGRARL